MLVTVLVSTLLPVTMILLLLFLVDNLPDTRRKKKMIENFTQPSQRLPIIGHLPLLLATRDDLFRQARHLFKTYGSRYAAHVATIVTVNIADPEAAEAVLSSSKNIEKSLAYDFLKPWLCEGLLTSSGARWHFRRKLLTPAFHFRILGEFSGHLERQAQTLVQHLTEALAVQKSEETINVVPLVARATLRSIQVTAMGDVNFNSGSTDSGEFYFQAIHSVGKACAYRFSRPWLWFRWGFVLFSTLGRTFYEDLKILHSFTERVIRERKRCMMEGKEDFSGVENGHGATRKKKSCRPFLDVLLSVQRDTGSLSDLDIREEVDTVMFEGHDTTAMAICWALDLLGQNPSHQDALAAELLSVDFGWESISRLPYLDRVFKECLRLRPSVPFIARFLAEDVDLGNGQVIPARSTVNLHIYDLHHNPEHFADPERFDPDRFLPENEQKRHPFAYLPFSAGPRNCIGKKFAQMEVKLFLAAIVRTFIIRSAVTDQIDAIADLVLRPREGIFLQLRKRNYS